MSARAAILIHCSSAEAREIRTRASLEHRTVSSYMIHVLVTVLAFDEKLFARLHTFEDVKTIAPVSHHPVRPRTTIMLRCSEEESLRIRRAAKRRGASISGYIVESLRRYWELSDKALKRIPESTAGR